MEVSNEVRFIIRDFLNGVYSDEEIANMFDLAFNNGYFELSEDMAFIEEESYENKEEHFENTEYQI